MQKKNAKTYLLSVSFILTIAIFITQISALLLSTRTVIALPSDQDSGWPECNGWLSQGYDKHPCRVKALARAKTNYPGTNKSFYDIGLPTPPSGDKDKTEGGTDQQWHDWGLWNNWNIPNVPFGAFLSYGTSCGIGPNAKECIPPTSTPTTKPSATPTMTPSATPTTKPSTTPTTTPSATPTTKPSTTPTSILTPTITVTPSIIVAITPSLTSTPVVTPTPEVKGDDAIFGFNLKKTVNGKLSYRVGELITFTVSMENSGTEKINKINMRDIYSPNMRVEAIYLTQGGQRRNVTSQFFANNSEMEGGNIMPRDPQNKNNLLDLTDFTGDLKPGEKITFEFIFKAISNGSQVCKQAYASANSRSEISSQKVCVDIKAVVPITD